MKNGWREKHSLYAEEIVRFKSGPAHQDLIVVNYIRLKTITLTRDVRGLGHTTATVKLYSSDLSKAEEISLLVDTGSTYTWVSRDMLKKLGIEAKTVRKFKTIDGRLLERKVGEVVIECIKEKATTMVVFAEKGDAEVLGVYTLEGLGLEVDPITKQLKKAEVLLAL